jgi:hypothetical protein
MTMYYEIDSLMMFHSTGYRERERERLSSLRRVSSPDVTCQTCRVGRVVSCRTCRVGRVVSDVSCRTCRVGRVVSDVSCWTCRVGRVGRRAHLETRYDL